MVSLFKKIAFLVVLLLCSTPVISIVVASGDQGIYISAINPPELYLGDSVHVYGGGATTGSVVVAKLVGLPRDAVVNNLTLGSAVAGETGDWQIDFVSPILFPGKYTMCVFDDRNVPSNLASFQVLLNITIIPATNFTYQEVTNNTWQLGPVTNATLPILFYVPLTAAPASGPAGAFVTIFGHYASGGEIQVYLNNTQVATVAKPSSGDWSTSFQVPSVSSGNYTIRAIDTGARIISFASFSVTSEVSMSPTPLLMLIGLFALAVFSGLAMLVLLAVYPRQRKKSASDRH
jgi:hypothetical protein